MFRLALFRDEKSTLSSKGWSYLIPINRTGSLALSISVKSMRCNHNPSGVIPIECHTKYRLYRLMQWRTQEDPIESYGFDLIRQFVVAWYVKGMLRFTFPPTKLRCRSLFASLCENPGKTSFTS